jgi:hypothetical protein
VDDSIKNKIKVWDKTGRFLGASGGGGSALGKLRAPMGLDLTPTGDMYISERDGDRVSRWRVGIDADPDTVLSTPAANEVFPAGLLAMAGSAFDDLAMDRVRLSIKDRVSGLWWDGVGWGGFVWVDAVVDAPGGVSSGWTFGFDGSGGSADYWVQVWAVDEAGKVDPSPASTRFTVSS